MVDIGWILLLPALRDELACSALHSCTSSGRRKGLLGSSIYDTMPDLVLFHAVPYSFRSRVLYHILHLQQSGQQLSDKLATRPSLGAGELLQLTRLFIYKNGGLSISLLDLLNFKRRENLKHTAVSGRPDDHHRAFGSLSSNVHKVDYLSNSTTTSASHL